jgi:hypothetical protein
MRRSNGRRILADLTDFPNAADGLAWIECLHSVNGQIFFFPKILVESVLAFYAFPRGPLKFSNIWQIKLAINNNIMAI